MLERNTSQSTASVLLAGVQWLFFIFTNTVMVPLSIGHALDLSPAAIAESMQRSFILTGVVCIVQAAWGHRFALMDGPAGVWWGLVLSICASAPAMGMDLGTVAASLASGFILSGVLVIVLALCGFLRVMKRLFSPSVMGVFLFLIAFQLENTFFKGMVGFDVGGRFDLPIAGLSVVIIAVVALIHIKGKGVFGQFSLLGGIVFGWIAYVLLFGQSSRIDAAGTDVISIWHWLPWGTPHIDPGILVVSMLAGIVNMMNTLTSLTAASTLYGRESTDKEAVKSVLFTNLFSIIAGCFGLIPFGTFASSIGFLENTRVLRRSALIVGAGLFIIVGAVPALSGWLVQLPLSVGGAALFAAYLQMFGTAFRTLSSTTYTPKTIYRIALPILTGICIMNLPASAFSDLPPLLTPLLSNGLVIGVLLVLVVENVVKWDRIK